MHPVIDESHNSGKTLLNGAQQAVASDEKMASLRKIVSSIAHHVSRGDVKNGNRLTQIEKVRTAAVIRIIPQSRRLAKAIIEAALFETSATASEVNDIISLVEAEKGVGETAIAMWRL